MSVCPACGAENSGARKFCGECGSPLARVCGACGSANESGVRFCGECGAALEAPPESAQVARSAERRLVSVLFADLVGFTTLSEGRDPEEVRELLSRYFETAQTLVGRYGGTIEKFIGDAVMAVWGTPVAREDDAERAVRAGLELVAAVAELGHDAGADVRLRAGIATGEAAVTLHAAGQGVVAGDLVNTAARVQSAADAGSVLVNDATRRASNAAIGYEDAGTHILKGKAEPVQLWRATQVTASRGGVLKSTVLEPPFVGRDREIRVLKELFHSAADDGASKLLTVVGIAGIGKSRLAWEFEKYLDGLAGQVWWHRGRCLAYGDGVSYWALAEMVRMRARIAEEEPAEEALPKLVATLDAAIPDEEERAWVQPRLAHLLALGEPQSFERQDLFSAWRLFFERLSDVNPVVLVFEDLQWGDVSLLDFVEHLLDWSRSHPIFVLALTRPEIAERRPGWGSAGRSSTTLSLDPLSDRAMGELMGRFVPGLPDELVAEILERSQGVPLYAVETVRMLLDRGLVKPEGDRYSITGPIGSLEVPETLHALIAARIDDLASDERAVVQDASVLGKSFTLAGLTALSGRAGEELEPLLGSLVRKEVLSVEADPRSPERGQYSFLQDLLQRVAYETLSRADRRSRHLAAAVHLETALEAEAAEVVAAHYVDAYRAAPDAPDAAEIRAKAGEALVRAGRRAASLGASEEADRAFVQAADLIDDPSERAELLAEAGDAAFLGGRYEAARERLEKSIGLYEDAGLRTRAARVAGQLGWSTWFSGDLAGGADRIEQALSVLADEEPDADLAALIEIYARLRFFLGDVDTAAERVERALEIAESLVLPDVLVDALNTKHLVLGARGRMEEGLALIEHAIAIGRERPPGRPFGRALYNLSYQFAARDRHLDAIEVDQEGLEVARRFGDRVLELQSLGHIGTSLTFLGRWDEALALIEQIDLDSSVRAAADRSMRVLILVHRGDVTGARNELDSLVPHFDDAELQMLAARLHIEANVLCGEGRFAEALESGRRAYRVCLDNGFTFYHPFTKWLLHVSLDAAFELGDRKTINELLATVDAASPVDRTPLLMAIEAAALGRAQALDGDLVEALRLLRDAARRFEQIDMPLEEGRALYHLGRALVSVDDAESAATLQQARSIFERLGAHLWTDRVDAVAVPVVA
jgi:class 3 adenylate cyclase/tetratricopeptide (TPR) repeat protein